MAAESARIALRCEEAKNTSKLDLEECGLRKFPDAIYFLLKNVMLHTVSIAHNDLTVLPKKFGLQLVTITSLDLSFNQLHSLPSEIQNLMELKSLNISNNRFTDIPAVVVMFTQLQQLDISCNQIQSLPDDFGILSELRHLNLAHNLFKDTVCFQLFPVLKELDMSHNQIQEVIWDGGIGGVMASAPWLEAIDLKGNPLKEETRRNLESIVRVKILISE